MKESLKWQPRTNLKHKRDFIPGKKPGEGVNAPGGNTHDDPHDPHGLPPPLVLPDPRKVIPNGLFFPNRQPIEDFPDIDTPLTWTSLLCHKELACDVHDNFAVPNRVGVDKATYINNLTWVDAGSDLKDQVRKWLEYEQMQVASNRNKYRETLFTVWFGISDVMKFSLLKKREGIVAVEHSLEVLFQELVSDKFHLAVNMSPEASKLIPQQEKIASHQLENTKARILLPYVIDVSLLPAYSNLLTQNASPDFSIAAEVQKNAIWLTTLWNQGLELRARQWEHNAQLILWNVHDWFLDEIRAGEDLQEIDLTLQPGTLKHANSKRDDTMKRGGWKNTKDACIGKRAGRWGVCDQPDSYLMW